MVFVMGGIDTAVVVALLIGKGRYGGGGVSIGWGR